MYQILVFHSRFWDSFNLFKGILEFLFGLSLPGAGESLLTARIYSSIIKKNAKNSLQKTTMLSKDLFNTWCDNCLIKILKHFHIFYISKSLFEKCNVFRWLNRTYQMIINYKYLYAILCWIWMCGFLKYNSQLLIIIWLTRIGNVFWMSLHK